MWVSTVQIYFEDCNHWLYIEEPDKFNHILVNFACDGLAAVRHLTCV
jgi:pimeloyl-ACP methyl ester carboxylesterase